MSDAPPDTPWYGDGLRFRCTGCGDCCTGEPGAVWVTEEDIARIAEHTGDSVGGVRMLRTRMVGGRRTLTEHGNGDCTFFDSATRRCGIYPVRPAQCRTWPFWPGTTATPADWNRTTAACPGAGCGDFVPVAEIRRRVAASGL